MSVRLPYHYRDDGGWCPFSECDSASGICPLGCAGAREHYANDGHPECADDAPTITVRIENTYAEGHECSRSVVLPYDDAAQVADVDSEFWQADVFAETGCVCPGWEAAEFVGSLYVATVTEAPDPALVGIHAEWSD